jgi:tRNA A37 methylthiotransferase MiaB
MTAPTVAIVTLGCARNEVDSEELAARLDEGGFRLVDDPGEATAVLVNTCGFIEQAKAESIDQTLAAADLTSGPTRAVVMVGCLAERYGEQLAAAMPEADAVLGFDAYPQIAARLRDVLAGDAPAAHTPRDRRTLLPLAPAQRPPAHGSGAHAAPDLP